MSKKSELTAADVTTYSYLCRRTGNDVHKPSIKAGAARRLLDEARGRLNPDETSTLNPSGTNRQIHEVLCHGLEEADPSTPLHYLTSRNIVKHCALSEKKWKQLWSEAAR